METKKDPYILEVNLLTLQSVVAKVFNISEFDLEHGLEDVHLEARKWFCYFGINNDERTVHLTFKMSGFKTEKEMNDARIGVFADLRRRDRLSQCIHGWIKREAIRRKIPEFTQI